MTEIGYACVVARKFSNDLTVSFQLNFPVGAEPSSINDELDKLAKVLERQQVMIDIPALSRQIEKERENLDVSARMIQDLRSKIDAPEDTRVRNGAAQKAQLETQHTNAMSTYKQQKENLARAEAYLESLKKAA